MGEVTTEDWRRSDTRPSLPNHEIDINKKLKNVIHKTKERTARTIHSYCPPFLYCIVRNDRVGESLLRGKEVDEGERDKETPRTRIALTIL